jgi:hypothetical protein
MRKKIILQAIIIVLLSANAPFRTQAQNQMPVALTNLMKLLGKWEGKATLMTGGQKHEFTYYVDFKKTADGSGLYMDEWFTDAQLGTMKGSNLIGYNNNDNKIHWFSVDNFGTAHDHLGVWKTNNHFYMQANEIQQKKKFLEKIDLVFKDDNTLEFALVSTLDNKEIEKGSAVFHRTK